MHSIYIVRPELGLSRSKEALGREEAERPAARQLPVAPPLPPHPGRPSHRHQLPRRPHHRPQLGLRPCGWRRRGRPLGLLASPPQKKESQLGERYPEEPLARQEGEVPGEEVEGEDAYPAHPPLRS